MTSIDQSLYEVSYLNGATSWQRFRYVTFPLLSPTILFVMITEVIFSFQIFDPIYIMTKGGPGNATNVLLFYIYQTGFDYWDTGKASAMTVILVAVLLVVTSVCFFVQDKKAYYNN